MKFSPRVGRFFFYGLLVAGGLAICVTVTLNSFSAAQNAIGIDPIWLAGLCCVIPFVLAGIALANESN